MALTIDNLEIQIEANANEANKGLDSLAASLTKLKAAVGDTSGLATNLKNIADALHTFSAVGKIRLTIPVNQLKKLESVIPTLGGAKATQMADNLRKIADSIATFSAASGVGKQMKDAAKGMDALAKSSQKLEAANIDANNANKSTLHTMSEFVNQYRRLYQVIDEVVDVCADWFNEANEYIEALNLFKVSMGDASDEALRYAETVSDAMGIDPAEWISNQGTFHRMATGFGIVSDEAEIMSQNLTQLAYDLSSFFNTDVTTAMQKLQSGMSGQIKGLKAWGYNLSVAALQETALSLGIEESVRNMTEAQKAQLRYITLIQKSNGIMGDMAKTINTPANAMRVLDAQITQMKRSLGNLVSIIATKVIPYIQAFVELMAEGAEALAKAWGFEIEDLPTNNLEMASEVIDGIGDDVENTTDAVSELKKRLAGFDELNILTSSGSDENEGLSNSLNIDLPEYDFLSNLDNETRKRIDEIKQQIKDLLPHLDALAQAITLAFAAKAIIDAKVALGKFFTKTELGVGIVDIFRNAMADANIVFEAGDGIFKSLKTGVKSVAKNFKDAMRSLSPLTKVLVSAIALGLEFDVVKNNVKGFADGSKSLGDALLAIIPTCGLVGVAMYAMWGPMGLVLAGVTAVTAALMGFVEAENEMRRQRVHDTFYDDYGISVSGLASKFNDLLTKSTSAFDTIFEKQSAILTAKDNIIDTKTEMHLLISEVENGATTIEEAIPRMTKALQSLYTDTKSYLTGTASLLYAALTGASMDGIETYMQTIDGLIDKSIEEIDASNNRLEEAKKQLEAGEITQERYWDIQYEEILKVSSWTTAESDLEKAVSGAKTTLSELFAEGINWDSKNIDGEFEKIANSAETAKQTITDAYKAIYDGIADMRHLAEQQENDPAILVLDQMLGEFKIKESEDLGQVNTAKLDLIKGLQTDLAEQTKQELEQALDDWDDLSGWTKSMVYKDSIANYVSARFKEYKDDIANPLIESLKSAFGSDAVWFDEFMEELEDSIFEKGAEDSWWRNSRFEGDSAWDIGETIPDFDDAIEDAIEDATSDVDIISGISDIFDRIPEWARKVEGAIPDAEKFDFPNWMPSWVKQANETVSGLSGALTDKEGDVYDAAYNLGDSVKRGYDDSLDINSPSLEMEKRGEYSIQGLVNGLNNTSLLSLAIDKIVAEFDILDPIKKLWNNVTNWWKNISLPDVNLFGNIGAKISGMFNIGGYASGGFPTMGEMFIARERGPELVGRIGNKNAVANNDQIIAGIASAVYSAMMAAQEDGNNGEGGSTRIVVQIGDQAVGEASVRYINGKIVQTGTSPIYS